MKDKDTLERVLDDMTVESHLHGPEQVRRPWVGIGGGHLGTGRWHDLSVGKGKEKEITSEWKTWRHLVGEKAK